MPDRRFYVILIILFSLTGMFISIQGMASASRLSSEMESRLAEAARLADHLPEKAVTLATELLNELSKPSDKAARARIFKILGAAHYNLGNERQAMEYYEQALTIYREEKDRIGIASVLNNTGLIRESQGDYSGALKRYNEASEIFTDENREKYLALTITNIGNVYYTLGRYDKALDYLSQALRLHERSGDSSGLSKSYNNIGNIYLSLKDYQTALSYYSKALEINKKLKNLPSLSTSYNNIGLVYQGMEIPDKAIEFNRLALELSRKINDRAGIIYSLVNTGNIYLDQGNTDQAAIYFQEAYRISSAKKEGFTHTTVLQGLAGLRNLQQKPDEAIPLYNEALTFAEKTGSLSLLGNLYRGLAESWNLKGDTDKAYNYMLKFSRVADSSYDRESNERLNRLRVSFESERTEKDNQLLRQQNIYSQLALKRQQTIRNLLIIISVIIIASALFLLSLYQSKKRKNKLLATQNEQIVRQKEELALLYKQQYKLNETKNKFFSIVAHDLKSPFQSILGFSELLSYEYENLDEKQRREAAHSIHKVSVDTFRLIENLLEWGRAQSGGARAVFKVFNVRDTVLNTLPVFEPQIQNKKLQLTYDLPEQMQAYADPDMIMAVIRNLISNAVKFSPPEGNIHLNATQNKNSVRISVKDSGNGIPSEIRQHLFTLDPKVQRAGTMGERGTGLGLTLCHDFMSLNKGSISVESEPGMGSTFTIVLQHKPTTAGNES